MCLFKYREKRYGKLSLILFAFILLALAAASVYGGYMAYIHMSHWAKYVIIVAAGLFALAAGGFGLFIIGLSFSMINQSKSVRDGNRSKGISGTRLCDKCGRVISKHADFCEHCGLKQENGSGMKKCPQCKTKNSATATFCEKCGTELNNAELE